MPLPVLRRAAAPAAIAAALALAPFALSAQTSGQTSGQTTAPAEAPADAAATAEPAPEPSISDVLATVNGHEITLGQIILMRANLPQQYQQIPDAQLLPALVDQAVTQYLLSLEAAEEGYGDSPLAKLRAELDKQSYLAEAKMRDMVAEATTDEKLQAAYEAQIASIEPAQEIRASHILVPEKETAEQIKADIAAGADFAEKAKEFGTDGTKDRGGDLGWFEKGQMVPEFADAAFAAEENVVTGPVETQFGWHLILVTGHRDQPVPTFEESREELAQGLAAEAAQAAVAEIRDGAEVVLSEDAPAPGAIRRDDLLTGN
ncbi:peptidyl-prolyl cis-trans isomerase C [Albimonas donghaensis]|uniref:Parvulin-like PPIase n=1 Tax=Albimonas donghaensis TaxID=356660 RepID=A0A1H3EWM4_9RHOB|nr:peptidylprolyl isomerase [Albimonas donghaensis]SDX83203.1 peptidyl-prolyl cis-trans isomerase C [Albimonas donghaensis]